MQCHKKNQDGSIIVILLAERVLYFKIDGIAAEIYSLLEKQKSIKQITQKLRKMNAKANRISEAILLTEVKKVVQSFKKKGLFSSKSSKQKASD